MDMETLMQRHGHKHNAVNCGTRTFLIGHFGWIGWIFRCYRINGKSFKYVSVGQLQKKVKE